MRVVMMAEEVVAWILLDGVGDGAHLEGSIGGA